MNMRNNKAQMTIFALSGIFVVLLVYSALYGTIQTEITNMCNSGTDESTCGFAHLIPTVIIIAILFTVIFFGLPTGE